MPLDLSSDCTFTGPALPEPFVKFNLEAELNRLALLPKSTGAEGRALDEHWKFVRRKLGALVSHGGGLRVQNHVIEPLLAQLGYARIETVEAIQTREGAEDGGALLVTEDGAAKLRVWCVDLNADLDAPARRGLAYRFSHTRIAQRVLLATGERLGILTNGLELRLLISDPARVDSQVAISVDPHWKRSRDLPDSVRLLIALASPAGVRALPELIDKARLQQAKVTKDLREQARSAIREFIQELLDHPANQPILASLRSSRGHEAQTSNPPSANAGEREQGSQSVTNAANRSPSPPSEGGEGRGEVGSSTSAFSLHPSSLPRDLWHEGLITVYRLLFILKLESTDDPARSFSFASTSLWRNTFSPSVALAPIVRRVLDHGAQTGRLLQDGLRALFRMLSDGLQCTELNVRPMAGALFAPATTPILGRLHWTEIAIAKLLDNLLWTRSGRGATARERVHYGPLDVEDLGRVYEALLELEPGITAEPMCRLRRAKLEVVVPAAQGERYRPVGADVRRLKPSGSEESEPPHVGSYNENDEPDEPEEEDDSARGKKTKVEWIEEIPPDRFYLRVGLGRKATGSFYTPHSFVRFLVRETLGPLVQRVSPVDDPQPCAILKLKVIDKAMGSGHFLVEACRFLGEALYDAARRCDELAASADKLAESYRASAKTKPEHQALAAEQEARAAALRQRVIDLPDPDDELLRYLPSRSVEGTAGGVSHNKAIALCRRMVAVHCLYGVDKNPLAVELAKLALWIECHAEGLPLTFLDHRLVVGDSLTGPFFEHLLKYPGSQQPLDDLFTQGLTAKLTAALADALQHVRALEATVGVTVADIEAKQAAKTRLDRALAPFKILAAAWSGGVMLGPEGCDDTAYASLAKHIAETGTLPDASPSPPSEGGEGRGEVGRKLGSSRGNEAQTDSVRSAPPNAGCYEISDGLRRMVSKGLGLPANADWPAIHSAFSLQPSALPCIPALSFDLAFPEVFYPDGNAANRVGFDADLGNPPWDAIQFKSKEFLAAFDLNLLESPTKRERELVERRLLADDSCRRLFDQYKEAFEETKRANDVLYEFQKVEVDGDLAGRQLDAFRVFMERAYQVLRNGGRTGVVVPSAFHANEGATGVRRLYLKHMALWCCFSFENRRQLFEIHRSFKFATTIAVKGSVTTEFDCAFYLQDDKWLFGERREQPSLSYSLAFVERTGRSYLTFLELRTSIDLAVAETCVASAKPFDAFCTANKVRIQGPPAALHMSHESHRFEEVRDELTDVRKELEQLDGAASANLVLFEGKHFHQFDDRWGAQPRYVVPISRAVDLPAHLRRARYYQLVIRKIARSTDERTIVSCILPPGIAVGDSALVDAETGHSAGWVCLSVVGVANSFTFDWIVRQMVAANITLFVLRGIAFPQISSIRAFLAHSALRLTCNHAGYAPLWREQLGEAWREAGAAFSWSVLSGDAARWAVRAAIDAVVAHAYGLTRDQYAHVLSTFSHTSYKDAPRQCLAAFDELQSLGLTAFTQKHDPYCNIPLNENLPQPVIDLPIPAADPGEETRPRTGELFDFQTTAAPRRSGMLFTEQPVARPKQRRRTT